MGNTVRFPARLIAITGTTLEGFTSPDRVTAAALGKQESSGERFISSTMGRSSGDSSRK